MLVSPVRLWASAPFPERRAGRGFPFASNVPLVIVRPICDLSRRSAFERRDGRGVSPNSSKFGTRYSRSRFGTFRIDMGRRSLASTRDTSTQPVVRRRQPRRYWSRVLLFAATVVLVNGLFGERGLMDSMRARRVSANAARELDLLRRENTALRAKASLLRSDPATIEAVARGELGLTRPGEILITIKDISAPRRMAAPCGASTFPVTPAPQRWRRPWPPRSLTQARGGACEIVPGTAAGAVCRSRIGGHQAA